jgi:hypothetical protein
MEEAEPLNFNNEGKIRRQMQRRGWTEEQLREALRGEPVAARGRKGPALRFIHPLTGKSVILDAATREIFHVGGEGFRYDD